MMTFGTQVPPVFVGGNLLPLLSATSEPPLLGLYIPDAGAFAPGL